ncbi:MAG: hypothetical protein ACK4MD_01730 [Demequina sp.]
MRGSVSRAVLSGAAVAVIQYALAPVLAFLLLRYRSEPGDDAAMPTWTGEIWIASAIVLGVAFAAGWRYVTADGRPLRPLVLALSCTAIYIVAATAPYSPDVSGEWALVAPLIAIGFSGAAVLAFVLTLVAAMAARRAAGVTAPVSALT